MSVVVGPHDEDPKGEALHSPALNFAFFFFFVAKVRIWGFWEHYVRAPAVLQAPERN